MKSPKREIKKNRKINRRRLSFAGIFLFLFLIAGFFFSVHAQALDHFLIQAPNNSSVQIEDTFTGEFSYGAIPLDNATYKQYLKPPVDVSIEATLPASYDARNDNIVTPAKNQGSCGSCWAFASVGAFESHMLKQFSLSSTPDLSEQQLVSCSLVNVHGGCRGGSMENLRFWENIGPVNETCYPYKANHTTPCFGSTQCGELSYRVTNFHTVDTSSTANVKSSVFNYGPTWFEFTVYSDFSNYWHTYSPGAVYVNSSATVTNGHAVLIIGWDDSKNAYLCKNSWGAIGGPNGNGTFWIAYSEHANKMNFRVANFSLTKITQMSISIPEAGDNVPLGYSQRIKWVPGDVTGNVKIELGRPGGCSGYEWSVIAASTPNSGVYTWTVGGLAQADCKIKITSISNPNLYAESGLFAIQSANNAPNKPTVVGDPNPAYVHSPDTVELSSSATDPDSHTIAEYRLEIYEPSNQTPITVTTGRWVDRSYNTRGPWQVYCTAVDEYGTLSTQGGPTTLHVADIVVNSPAAEDTLIAGNSTTIEWDSWEFTGNVKIELGRPGGCGYGWSTIAASVANTGTKSYTWTVENPGQSDCKIRVSSVDYGYIYGESGLFTIVGATTTTSVRPTTSTTSVRPTTTTTSIRPTTSTTSVRPTTTTTSIRPTTTTTTINQAPLWDSVFYTQYVDENVFLNYYIPTATDPEGNTPVSYSCVQKPSDAVFYPLLRQFQWRPSYDAVPAGTSIKNFTITVRATDSLGNYRDANFTVYVYNVNRAPSVIAFMSFPGLYINQGETIALTATASDPDTGDTLNYTWYVGRRPDLFSTQTWTKICGPSTSSTCSYVPNFYGSYVQFRCDVKDLAGATALGYTFEKLVYASGSIFQ